MNVIPVVNVCNYTKTSAYWILLVYLMYLF